MEEKKSDKKPDSEDIEKNKVVAAVSYIWILCLLPLFLKRDSAFCQFHAKQGLVLFIIEIVGWLIFWIPFIGWLLFIIILIFAVMGLVNALQGNYWKMPFIGDLAEKINL